MEIQVINDSLEYNNQFGQYLKKQELQSRGNDYNTVAVIGCQSSGKSTLLNLLFDTKFEIMDNNKGPSQTTKGIWLARNKIGSNLIFDIEGTDSKERGEQRMTFEQTTSLFALAIADVLLINMWTTDIGRYGASNYGLLKVIFEVNLKLFNQHSAKKLLFVLRDFDDRGNNRENIQKIIDKDIATIWNDIYKPPELENSQPQDFFQFDFFMLPHKIFEEARFIEKSQELRQKFEDHTSDIWPKNHSKNVPLDGLACFIEQTWDLIKNQKELNLPDQREMVANFRCNEFKVEALQLIQEDIQKLKAQCEEKMHSDFKGVCKEILAKAVSHYDESAHQYDKKVHLQVRIEVVDGVLTALYMTFDAQLKMLRQTTYEQFTRQVKKLSMKDQVNETFALTTQDCYKQTTSYFTKKSQSLVLDGSGWGEQVITHERELKMQLKEFIQAEREKELKKLNELTLKAAKESLEEIVNQPIHNLEENFWENITIPYQKELGVITKSCEDMLQKAYECSMEEVQEFIRDITEDIYTYIVDYIRKLFKDINTNLLRKFCTIYKKDQDGKPRNWVKMEELQIRELFDHSKGQVVDVIIDFKYVRIPRPNVRHDADIKINGAENGNDNDDFSPLYKRTNSSLTFARLLSEQEINKVKDRFNEDTENEYDESIRKHKNQGFDGIPMWFWGVLFFFAIDNIMSWLASPIIFYPFVIVVGGIALLYSWGFGPVMVPLAREAINAFLSKLGVAYRMQ